MKNNQRFPKVSEETKSKMYQLYKETTNIMSNLYSRWLDEHEYEDIKDYSIPLLPILEKLGAKFETMKKRPFGFICSIDGIRFHYYISKSTYNGEVLPLQ